MVFNDNLNEFDNQKKIKMLNEMKEEIENLKYQQKNIKSVIFKTHLLRVVKILLNFSKRISPYMASALAAYFVFKYINHAPFYMDDVKKKLEIQKEFDSKGNIRYEMQYEDFEEEDNIIKIYGKWNKDIDGYYVRDIKSYQANRISLKRIEEIIEDNNLTIESMLGEPFNIKKEKRNNLTSDEINSNMYIEAIIYTKDENDYINIIQKSVDDIADAIGWLTIIFLMHFMISLIGKKINQESFCDYVKRIKREYPIANAVELEKLIEIKTDNYKRLVK